MTMGNFSNLGLVVPCIGPFCLTLFHILYKLINSLEASSSKQQGTRVGDPRSNGEAGAGRHKRGSHDPVFARAWHMDLRSRRGNADTPAFTSRLEKWASTPFALVKSALKRLSLPKKEGKREQWGPFLRHVLWLNRSFQARRIAHLIGLPGVCFHAGRARVVRRARSTTEAAGSEYPWRFLAVHFTFSSPRATGKQLPPSCRAWASNCLMLPPPKTKNNKKKQ